MTRILPVFRSAKNTRPSEAKARAIGHARPVWTGASCTAGLFGFPPPPGRLTKYQADAKVARIATAAMTTATIVRRFRGSTEPERLVRLKGLVVRSHSASATRRTGEPDVPCKFRGRASNRNGDEPRTSRFATFSITGTFAPTWVPVWLTKNIDSAKNPWTSRVVHWVKVGAGYAGNICVSGPIG